LARTSAGLGQDASGHGELGLADVAGPDSGAVRRECHADGPADAVSGPGDDRDAPGEAPRRHRRAAASKFARLIGTWYRVTAGSSTPDGDAIARRRSSPWSDKE